MKRFFLYAPIILLTLILFVSPFFIRAKIECQSQYGECPAEIESGLMKLAPGSLIVLRNEVNSYLKKNYLVSSYSVQFKLPDIIQVDLIVKKPYFAIKSSTTGGIGLVDNKGIILSLVDSTPLPTLVTQEPISKPGQVVSNQDLFALNLILGMNAMYQINYGTIMNDSLVVDMNTGVRVIFPLEGDDQVLLGAVRLIYTKVTSNYLGTYSQIDMRYKNPVLR